jgi:hypothetical protein
MTIAKITVFATSAETYKFTLEWTDAEGDTFPFDDYEIEYAVTAADGTEQFRLTQDDGGVVTDDVLNTVTFTGGYAPLEPGNYVNHCRLKVLDTGEYVTVFTGPVTIINGGFTP